MVLNGADERDIAAALGIDRDHFRQTMKRWAAKNGVTCEEIAAIVAGAFRFELRSLTSRLNAARDLPYATPGATGISGGCRTIWRPSH